MTTLIETERLIVRQVTLEDKEDMFALHNDPEVQKLTGESIISSMEEMQQGIVRRLDDYKKYGYGRWAVIEKHTNDFIGWAGLAYLPEFDKVDIGYRFKKKHWGKGYATEASRGIIDYAFTVLNLDLIIAIALPENKASISVMKKIGMLFDKQAPYDEEILDAIWYKMDRADYDRFQK